MNGYWTIEDGQDVVWLGELEPYSFDAFCGWLFEREGGEGEDAVKWPDDLIEHLEAGGAVMFTGGKLYLVQSIAGVGLQVVS
jgi:hypothetical protein